MSFTIHQELPSPDVLKELYPLSPALAAQKALRDQELRDIFEGRSDKFILIVGPCSADNEESVTEYVRRLKELNEEVKDKIFLIPRVYTNKPRTTGEGYKGMLHQPDPNSEPDLLSGIDYFDDVLAYEAVGARSVENQQHRLVASGADIPVGMKNPTSGDLSVMINSVIAAQAPQSFIHRMFHVSTPGNPLTHTILRGGVDKLGNAIPNYHYEDLKRLQREYEKTDLANPAVIVDCNHYNSGKQYREQVRIAKEVMHSRKYDPDIRKLVKGLMIESYLKEGRQDICENYEPGLSITDPCLGWEDTQALIRDIYENL